MVSVTEDRTLTWRAEAGRLLCRSSRRRAGATSSSPVYKENGAVVALRRAVLDGADALRREASATWRSTSASAFTVHDLEDFWMAERLLRQPRILFRVDGSAAMGMGHVYRSLAIADALRESSRADIAFLMTRRPCRGDLTTVSRYGYPVRVAGERRARDAASSTSATSRPRS